MMRKLLFVTLCFLFLGSVLADKVLVQIYYETYNEHVRKFMVEELGPLDRALNQFGDRVQVRYYPYGESYPDGDKNYNCSNGQTQCFVNALHLCYIGYNFINNEADVWPNEDYVNSQARLTSFIGCFFKNRKNIEDPIILLKSCGGMYYNRCSSGKVDLLQLNKYMEEQTMIAQIKNGLAVRVDGVKIVEKNLLQIICNKMGADNNFDACKSTSQLVKQKVSVYYEANDMATRKYFSKQLFPYNHVLEDFVDIELIPYGNIKLDENYKCLNDSLKTKCLSTVFQALIVNKYTSPEFPGDIISGTNRAINFVNCLFSQDASQNIFNSLKKCSDDNLDPDEYREIITSMKVGDDDYKNIMKSFANRTEFAVNGSSLKTLPRIPYVKLNDKESINTFNDIVFETCHNYQGPSKPTICNKVIVDVLYQPMDHTTRTVFLENIKPLFDNLQNVVKFNFIPAGSLKLKPVERKYECTTPELCDSLRYQACVIDNYWNISDDYTSPIRQDVFDVIHCMFKNKMNRTVESNAKVCFQQIDAWFNLEKCFENDADAILGDNIKETDGILVGANEIIDLVEFPAIVYQRNELVKPAELKKKICDNFDEYHMPDFCEKETPQKLKLKVFYNSDSELTKSFFTTQYDPWYTYLEEMLDVELFPGANSSDPTDGECASYEPDSICFANKIQSFVIETYQKNPNKNDYIDGTMRTMHFLRCLYSHPLWKIDYIVASENCADSELGADESFNLIVSSKADKTIYYKVLANIKKFLKKIEPNQFELLPWVSLGTDVSHRKRAANDLLQTACALWQGDKPLECTPVNVEIYYSGFHPQSRRFFVDELIPVFRNLRERIHLDLIPYGTLNKNDSECKSNACKVNTLQACAIKMYFQDEIQEEIIQWDGKIQTLSYIHCMFKNVKNDQIYYLSKACANDSIVSVDEIHRCALSDDGKTYLDEMKQRTSNLMEKVEHAPWIVINGKRIAAAQTDLRKAICDVMIGDLPEYCSQPRAPKVALQVHYSALDDASRNYILNELYDNYRNLEEIMDLDLVSLGQCEVLETSLGHSAVKCDNHDKEAHTALIHACVHDIFWNDDDDPISDNDVENNFDGKIQVIEFLKCYYSSSFYPDKPEEAGKSCVKQVFVDSWGSIQTCVDENGVRILKRYQDEKVEPLLPSLSYTPWITVNKVHNYAVENHILRTVCDSYKGREKPAACYEKIQSDPKPNVQVHYEIKDVKSIPFFVKYLLPERANEIGNLEFIPFGRSKADGEKFVCKNDNDCDQYILHLCLIDVHFKTDAVRTMKTIACTFESDNFNDKNAVHNCYDREFNNDAFGPIGDCANNQERTKKLLKNAQEATTSLGKKISHSPWIVINKEHNLEAENNILDELCSVYYPIDRPVACKIDLLPVNVFYQTKDDNVATFFSNQLYEYVQYLNEIGKFDYIPYGKTVVDDKGNFVCSTPEQCTSNMAQACVIDIVMNDKVASEEDRTLNQIRLGEFLVCTFTAIAPSRSTFYKDASAIAVEKKCAELNLPNIPHIWKEVNECITTERGKNLIVKAMNKTEEAVANKGDMPFIQIGDKAPEKTKSAFFQVLCDTYDLIRPPLCRTIREHGVQTGLYFSGNAASKRYFNTEVEPLYRHITPGLKYDILEDEDEADEKLYRLIKPELIPWGNTMYDPNAEKPFTCSNDNECYINQFFACAISAHRSEPRSKLHLMEFAVCFFAQENALDHPSNAAEKCTDLVWTLGEFVNLNICAKSVDQASVEKLLVMKEKTESFLPAKVQFPAVTIKNNYNSQASETYLRNFLCWHYQGIDKPEGYCSNYNTIPGPLTPPTEAPVTEAPVTEAPVTEAPVTEAPVTDDSSEGSTEGSTTPSGPNSATMTSYTIFVMIATFFLLSQL